MESTKKCPDCSTALVTGRLRDVVVFECPNGDGVGIPLGEAYGYFQRDELAAIWRNSKSAPLSDLLSPISGEPMYEVTFTSDSDHRVTESGGVTVTIEVDRDNYFGWFEMDELQQMPLDSGRGPRAPGLVGLDQMDDHDDAHASVYSTIDSSPDVEADRAEPDNRLLRLLMQVTGKLR